MKPSHVIRPLSDTEINVLRKEYNQLSEKNLKKHSSTETYNKWGGLRDGKSVWLHDVQGDFVNQKEFSGIIKIIKSIKEELNYKSIGRCYIHKLDPGMKIYPHTDKREPYFYEIDRFQLYLSKPQNLSIIQKGSTVEENSLIFFNHLIKHSYYNESEESFILTVFDFFKETGNSPQRI